jgi:hypothetical protein
VALLARASRLANLHAHGVILEDLTTKRRTVIPVPIADRLAPDDTYDLVMVRYAESRLWKYCGHWPRRFVFRRSSLCTIAPEARNS